MMLMGKVKILKMDPIVAFANDIKIPANAAFINPSTWIPGINLGERSTTIPINRNSITILFITFPFRPTDDRGNAKI